MKIATVKYMEISVIKMMAEFRKLSKKMTKDKIWRKLNRVEIPKPKT